MSKARILVIDDHLYFRSFMEGLLEEEGYVVQTADGGASGLDALAREGPFDLVLSDLVMPGMDGIETVRRIRERFPEQDVIVVTGVGDVRSAVEALRVGAAEYLLKPVDRDDLIHSIESVLEQRRLRLEHDRLVSENRAFLGFLSVLDRGLGLLGRLRREEVATGLLDMLCVEAGAEAGTLWVSTRGPEGEEFRRMAARGDVSGSDETLRDLPRDRDDSLRQGRVDIESPEAVEDPAGPALWVPSTRDRRLWAVARLSRFESGSVPPETRAACAKLGEIAAIAFENIEREETLERESLRDPRTGLHTRAFLEDVVSREIHRGQRYGRSFVLLALTVGGPDSSPDPEVAPRVAHALQRTLRPAEVIASEGTRTFWVLAPETDAVGSVMLKRRLVEAVEAELNGETSVAAGVANFPGGGESFARLAASARTRLEEDRQSIVRSLGLRRVEELGELSRRLRYQASFLPEPFCADLVQLILDEIRTRPDMAGLLFLAPGADRAAVYDQLTRLGRRPLGTEIFVATDGDTVPISAGLTPLPLPQGMTSDSTWVVRFGDAPPYLLIAGPVGSEGGRPVFHSDDRSLVEHVVARLRAEIGFGVGVRP